MELLMVVHMGRLSIFVLVSNSFKIEIQKTFACAIFFPHLISVFEDAALG